jgi:hypothetical protein
MTRRVILCLGVMAALLLGAPRTSHAQWSNVETTDATSANPTPNLINIYAPGGANTSLLGAPLTGVPAGWTYTVLSPSQAQLYNPSIAGASISWNQAFSGTIPFLTGQPFVLSFQFVNYDFVNQQILSASKDAVTEFHASGGAFSPGLYAGPAGFQGLLISPEPGTFALLGLGLGIIALRSRLRRAGLALS